MSYTPTEWEPTDVVTATRINALEQAVGDMNMSYTPNTWSDGDILSAEKMNALEQAVASGGGGSSDFSTAEVLITNNTANDVLCLLPIVTNEGVNALGYLYSGDSGNVTIPLYNGTAILFIDSAVILTGDIADEDGLLYVTGNGTITIS